MILGFIGTGNIVSDVVTGISKSKISFNKIIISPRNEKKAKFLKRKFKKILIAKNNQEVINKSDWVFLGVLPKVGEKILPSLRFKKKQTVISFMSTPDHLKLRKHYVKTYSKSYSQVLTKNSYISLLYFVSN